MATINITYGAGAAPTLSQSVDIVYAVKQWEACLLDNVTLNIQIWAVNMTGTGLNGINIPGIIQTANSTLTRALAKATGHLAPSTNLDMVIAFDTATPWVLGTGPHVPVNPGEFSLATTMLHEICHGLGFLGLCDVDTTQAPPTGIYTASVPLIARANALAAAVGVNLPAYFFPNPPASGFGVITPFANLFHYTNGALAKGVAADDYTAFTTANDIQVPVAGGINYTVYTSNPFRPFTTCDHITGAAYLMNISTVGQYYATPDVSSRNILRQIGWNI